jgi:ABC-type transporter Mla subunit MlaD
MMGEPTGDKKNLENLLKALSVSETLETFDEIDKDILKLLNCATEDFLSLNEHFKSYHKESKNISLNASSVVQIITDGKIKSSFDKLSRFKDTFQTLTNTFSKHVEVLDLEIKKTTNKLENLKIAHNNYRQNLMSLKMLLANLQIDSISDDKNSQSKRAEIDSKTENIKLLISATDNLIEQFVTIAMESYVLLNSIKKENYEQIQSLNDNIEISFTLANKKSVEASGMFPSLKELADKNASSIAIIITNLQYHDIIMQKIEHIRRTHTDLISDLREYNKEDNSHIMLLKVTKTFMKIRDIAGLQAAQLLHANKQYQAAIKEIGKNLEQIGNEMITVSSLCENLVGRSSQTQKFYLESIIENLKNALQFSNKLSDFITNIKQHTQALSNKNQEFSRIYSDIHTQKESIKEILKVIKKIESDAGEKENGTINQINSLLKETDRLENYIQEIHTELNHKVEEIVNPKENFLVETNILDNLKDLSTTLPGIIEILIESIKKIDEFLNTNSTLSINVSENIKSSLKDIKYYDLFEKVSEEIIEKLNGLNLKLSYGSTQDQVDKEENLKHLKARYTMASEHIIHERISKKKDLVDEKSEEEITNLDDQNSETDSDNLELF